MALKQCQPFSSLINCLKTQRNDIVCSNDNNDIEVLVHLIQDM